MTTDIDGEVLFPNTTLFLPSSASQAAPPTSLVLPSQACISHQSTGDPKLQRVHGKAPRGLLQLPLSTHKQCFPSPDGDIVGKRQSTPSPFFKDSLSFSLFKLNCILSLSWRLIKDHNTGSQLPLHNPTEVV